MDGDELLELIRDGFEGCVQGGLCGGDMLGGGVKLGEGCTVLLAVV